MSECSCVLYLHVPGVLVALCLEDRWHSMSGVLVACVLYLQDTYQTGDTQCLVSLWLVSPRQVTLDVWMFLCLVSPRQVTLDVWMFLCLVSPRQVTLNAWVFLLCLVSPRQVTLNGGVSSVWVQGTVSCPRLLRLLELLLLWLWSCGGHTEYSPAPPVRPRARSAQWRQGLAWLVSLSLSLARTMDEGRETDISFSLYLFSSSPSSSSCRPPPAPGSRGQPSGDWVTGM